MLVLESGSSGINTSPPNMLTPNGSQYLQPDYLSPLPSSLDSKRSPLALLAQTCSQIGADPPSTKSDKSRPKESPSSSGSSNSTELKASSKTPPTTQHKTHDNHKSSEDYSKSDFKSPAISSSKSYSSTPSTTTTSSLSSSVSESRSSESKSDSTSKSSLDSLQGLPKDVPLGSYRPPNMFSSLSGLGPYPGLDPATAAALGLGAAGAFRHPYPHLGSLPSYPPVSLGLGLSAGYSSLAAYGRLKGVSGSDPLMPLPVCRDPYCTGCPSSMLGLTGASPATSAAAAATGAVCPAGCTQCDHQKILINSTAASSSSTTVATSSSSSPYSPSAQQRPYVCNWIAGDNYCGKRFGSSEELLQHLRTHTSLSVPSSDSSSFSGLLNPSLHPHSHLLNHRTYPTPPLSPLSMARYHPYSKPGAPAFTSLTPSNPLSNPLASLGSANPLLGLSSASANPLGALGATPSSLSASPFPPSHLSPYAAAAAAAAAGLPAVGAYYSNPYSFYSQRLGASVLP